MYILGGLKELFYVYLLGQNQPECIQEIAQMEMSSIIHIYINTNI